MLLLYRLLERLDLKQTNAAREPMNTQTRTPITTMKTGCTFSWCAVRSIAIFLIQISRSSVMVCTCSTRHQGDEARSQPCHKRRRHETRRDTHCSALHDPPTIVRSNPPLEEGSPSMVLCFDEPRSWRHRQQWRRQKAERAPKVQSSGARESRRVSPRIGPVSGACVRTWVRGHNDH